MDNVQLNTLAQDYFVKKSKLDAIMEAEKEARALKDQAEQKLVESMVSGNMQKASFEGLGTFSLRRSTNWTIVDQKKIVEFLKVEAPDMIKIHPVSIKGWANEFRETKEDAPIMDENDWINFFGMKPYDKIGITLRRA